jgi:hypothetical protein
MFEVRVPPASVLRGEISGHESRENEIEFCVREEREREKRREERFILLSRESRDWNSWLW